MDVLPIRPNTSFPARRNPLPAPALIAFLLAAIAGSAGALRCGAQDTGKAALPEVPVPAKEGDLPAPVNDAKAIEIINRYIEAIGGKENLSRIKDKTVKFETIKHQPGGNATANLRLYIKDGYKIREEWDLPQYTIKEQKISFVQVYNGLEGWVQMLGTVSPLEGRTLGIFVWDKPLDDFFCRWEADGYTLKYVGESTVDNEPVEVVQTIDFSGKSLVRYSFSKASGLLLKKEWREQGQNAPMKKETFFLNYRKIPFTDDSAKWTMVALHHRTLEDSKPDTERKYTEISLNTGLLRDAIFERPEGIEFKGGIGPGGRGTPPGLPGDGSPAPGPGAGPAEELVPPPGGAGGPATGKKE